MKLQRVLKSAHLGVTGSSCGEEGLALVVCVRTHPNARLEVLVQLLALVGLVDDKIFDKCRVGLGVHLQLGKIIKLI